MKMILAPAGISVHNLTYFFFHSLGFQIFHKAIISDLF